MNRIEKSLFIFLILAIGFFSGVILYGSVIAVQKGFTIGHTWMIILNGISALIGLFTLIYSIITLRKIRHFSKNTIAT